MKALYRLFFNVLPLTAALLMTFTGCKEDLAKPDLGPAPSPILFVANQTAGGGSLTMIDLGSGAVSNVDNAPLGDTPNDIILKDDLLYIVNSGSHNINTVRIVNRSTIVLEDTIWIGGRNSQRSPQHGVVYHDDKIYVTNYADGTISVYDLAHHRPLYTLEDVGVALADITAVGAYLYVCDTGWDAQAQVFNQGRVLVINTETEAVDAVVNVAANPTNMALDADGRLHVICSGEPGGNNGQVRVINPNSNSVVQVINLGGEPGDVVINSHNIAYVAAGGWDAEPGLVFRYDAGIGEVLNGPDDPIEVGRGAMRVTLGEDDAVYVSCNRANRIDKIVDAARVNSYTVGQAPGPMVLFY